MTGCSFLFLLVYCWVNRRQAGALCREPLIGGWFLFLLIWPLLHLLVGNIYDLRQAVLYGHIFLLMVSSALWIQRSSPQRFLRWGTAVLVAEAAGVVWSLFFPEWFEGIFRWMQRENTFQGRAFGWAMQPNEQARDMLLLFLIWAAFIPRQQERRRLAAYLMLVFLVVATGSRSGYAAVILSFFVHICVTYFRVQEGRLWMQPGPVVAVGFFAGLLFSIFPLLIRIVSDTIPSYKGTYGLVERVDSLVRGNFTQVSRRGESTVEPRILKKIVFFQLSKDRPLFGYGLGAQERLQETEELLYSTHDQYLLIAFEGGWLLVLFYLLLNASLYLHPQRAVLEGRHGVPFVLQIFLVILWFGFFSNTLLDSRTYAGVTGFLIGLMNSLGRERPQ